MWRTSRRTLLEQLTRLVPPALIDNDILTDTIEITAPEALGAERTRVYRGRMAGEPVAALLSPIVTQGYNGLIRLIVAMHSDGRLFGVRVLAHRETPGLGDKIEVERSDWILGFAGKSLDNPSESGWRVRRDGGHRSPHRDAAVRSKLAHRALSPVFGQQFQIGQLGQARGLACSA